MLILVRRRVWRRLGTIRILAFCTAGCTDCRERCDLCRRRVSCRRTLRRSELRSKSLQEHGSRRLMDAPATVAVPGRDDQRSDESIDTVRHVRPHERLQVARWRRDVVAAADGHALSFRPRSDRGRREHAVDAVHVRRQEQLSQVDRRRRELGVGEHGPARRAGSAQQRHRRSGSSRIDADPGHERLRHLPLGRFYIPPAYGDSHFFSASVAECAQVQARYPFFDYETPSAFYVYLPDAATGACAQGAIPVYRVWDNRPDTNHRYTTDPAVRGQMVARGWIPEGAGIGVVACVPN
jgi:hypothetical protein